MPSIHKQLANFKRKIAFIPFDIFIAVVISLVGFAGFALGWIAHSQQPAGEIQKSSITFPHDGQGIFVASENSDKYHYRWCSGAQRISADNRIYFSSKEEAREKGYTPAQNCPGL